MEPASSGSTPNPFVIPPVAPPAAPEAVDRSDKAEATELENMLEIQRDRSFLVTKAAVPPFKAIEAAVKMSRGAGIREEQISDIYGTFETDAKGGVIAETFTKDGREQIKFSVTWNVNIGTLDDPQVIKIKQDVYTGVEVPKNTSTTAGYDPVAALEEAKNKAYLLAKSYELIQRVGYSKVGKGDIDTRIRDCANLSFSPVGNPSTLAEDEPFAREHSFRLLKVYLPDGGLARTALELADRFYEENEHYKVSLNPTSFLKEITSQFIVLKTSTRGVNDFEALENAPDIRRFDDPAIKSGFVTFLKNKNKAYLNEKRKLQQALNTLTAGDSPLVKRLQKLELVVLIKEYSKARKDYDELHDGYNHFGESTLITAEFLAKLQDAQKKRDLKAKAVKQQTGLGALGMIANRLITLNKRITKNNKTMESLGIDLPLAAEDSGEFEKGVKGLVRDFKDRQLRLITADFIFGQVNGVARDVAAEMISKIHVGTDPEALPPSETLQTSEEESVSPGLLEGITDALDHENGDDEVDESEDEQPNEVEPLKKTPGHLTTVASSAYASAFGLWNRITGAVQQLSKSFDLENVGDAINMLHTGESGLTD